MMKSCWRSLRSRSFDTPTLRQRPPTNASILRLRTKASEDEPSSTWQPDSGIERPDPTSRTGWLNHIGMPSSSSMTCTKPAKSTTTKSWIGTLKLRLTVSMSVGAPLPIPPTISADANFSSRTGTPSL